MMLSGAETEDCPEGISYLPDSVGLIFSALVSELNLDHIST